MESLAQRCLDEHRALSNIKDALRATLSWQTPAAGLSKKNTSLVFILRALQRHLAQQLALEEHGGYMKDVYEANPTLVEQAQRLESEHDVFRASLEELAPLFEQLEPRADGHYEFLCDQVRELLIRIDEHETREHELLQEAFLRDEGGEG